jgi:hypothetical protein
VSRLATRALIAVATGGTAIGATAALSHAPHLVGVIWDRGVGPWATFLLSRLTGPLPFALVEPLFAAWLAWRLVRAAGALRDVARRRHRALGPTLGRPALGPSRAPTLGRGALLLSRDLGVATALFYVLWGVGYAQAPLERRLGWSDKGAPASVADADQQPSASVANAERPPATVANAEELARLAEQMVDAANAAYFALHAKEDAGAPTRVEDARALDAAVESGWRRVAISLDLAPAAALRHGRSKPLLASQLLRRAGLSGFYSPFTGEANVNASVPGVELPQVIGHEKAHQRAVNREDEANFLGWLAAASAPDTLARYSAAVFAQRQILQALIAVDAARARALAARRYAGVQRDIDDLRAYWRVSEGRTGKIADRINDAYLRGNRVPGGTASYGRSVELLLAWARRHDGRLVAAGGSR